MGKRRYELGVSLYRRHSLLRTRGSWQVVTAVFIFALFGAGLFHAGSMHGLIRNASLHSSGSGELAHQDHKIRTSSSDQTLTRSNGLRVRRATVLTPSSTPSAILATNSSDTAVAVGGTQVTATPDTAVSSVTATADNLVSQGADAAAPAATIPVDLAGSTPADNSASDATPATPAAVPVQISVTQPQLPSISIPAPASAGLDNATKKDVAMQLVSSAENSTVDWKSQYAYIEDIKDGRGYTAGIIGFCSGTGDMLELVQSYTKLEPSNPLAAYLPALQKVNGSSSHSGLDPGFPAAWKSAATDPVFQKAQNDERDRVYFNPAVSQAKADGLRALGQFMYYDAIVMHGPGNDATSFGGIRAAAMKQAKTPAQGGNETAYLNAFLDARVVAMKTEAAHDDVDRVETEQRVFLQAGNLDLNTPLTWSVYGDPYSVQ